MSFKIVNGTICWLPYQNVAVRFHWHFNGTFSTHHSNDDHCSYIFSKKIHIFFFRHTTITIDVLQWFLIVNFVEMSMDQFAENMSNLRLQSKTETDFHLKRHSLHAKCHVDGICCEIVKCDALDWKTQFETNRLTRHNVTTMNTRLNKIFNSAAIGLLRVSVCTQKINNNKKKIKNAKNSTKIFNNEKSNCNFNCKLNCNNLWLYSFRKFVFNIEFIVWRWSTKNAAFESNELT